MYDTNILVSQETKDLCSGVVFRFVDNIYVKGRGGVTTIYEPLCLEENKTDVLEKELAVYDKAMELYKASDWSSAKEEFAKLMKQYPEAGIYAVYFERISGYEKSPPAADWDHVQRLTRK